MWIPVVPPGCVVWACCTSCRVSASPAARTMSSAVRSAPALLSVETLIPRPSGLASPVVWERLTQLRALSG